MHASPVYHSRIHQSPVYRSLPGISGGEVSTGALKFDGVNDYVSCGTLIRLQTHTVCGWAQMSGAGAENMLAGVGTDIRVSGIEWAVRSGALAFAFNNGGIRGWYPAPNSTPKPATGVWFHWAVTWDSSSGVAKFYVNGAGGEIVATATGPIVYSAGDNFLIGLASYNPFWYGKQDDVRIYNTALSAAQVAALYANTTPAPTSGLVGHWKFDDGSGLTAVDSSGYGNAGTLTNFSGTYWEVQVPPRLSRNRLTEDWSVAFDGVNDYINVAACNLGLNNATTVSVALWIKTTDTNGRILQKQISDSWSTIAVLLLSGSIYFGVQNSGINQYPQWITSSTVNDGNWHHIVCVFSKNAINSSDAQIYIDGALATTSYTANNYTSAFLLEEVSSNLVFGVRPVTLTDPLAGNIKDVRIYSSALAQSDITKLCNGQESTAVPVAQWRLNDGSGTNANDEIGTNDGTLTNGPTWSGDVPQWHRQIVDSTHAAV